MCLLSLYFGQLLFGLPPSIFFPLEFVAWRDWVVDPVKFLHEIDCLGRYSYLMSPSVPSSSRKPMIGGLVCFSFKCFAKTTSWGHCDLPLGGISCPCLSLSLWYRTKWSLPGSIISLGGWKMEHCDLIISFLFISWNSWRGRFPWQLLGCPGYSLHRKARLITWFFFFPLVFWVSCFLSIP